ncbi:RNA degradosome polyphosphate kinase [Bacillus marasmi]|uniref:RNA degradosome polyphosphate kinase n=1 Tax=Bacillus marasmi TaxID=1926279 RepID=UPI0011C9AF43|nr:RNA degradosome polyphosphate kinase [Bacillus marasmi]
MLTVNKKSDELNRSKYYINRELSWLSFNKRVLEEAIDTRNPLLERCKFIAVFSSNLDEFFMVRVAGLKDQVKAGYNKPEKKAGLTPKQQLEKISIKTHNLVIKQYETLNQVLVPMLKEQEISLLQINQLTDSQLIEIEDYFDKQIFPVLTPMAIDAYHPFPIVLNNSLNIAVVIEDDNNEGKQPLKIAIVQVPKVLNRFVQLHSADNEQLILLEDIICHFIDKLFVGYQVHSLTVFRITRNADLTIQEEGASDLLKEIEKELKKRKWGAAVRLEIQKQRFDRKVLKYLSEELELKEQDVYEIDGPLDLTMFFQLYKKLEFSHSQLMFNRLIPQSPQSLLDQLFEAISTRDILLHHPYESFEPVVEFVSKAATDPNVLAIKQTLYRVSGDSPIIHALKRAAENGKQVTVLVELRARFDEKNNVHWAKELEKAGCHVIYGKHYLKTHSKITLVVRRKSGQIERLVHLGTGNYNDQTAKLYTDFGLFTANPKIGVDATNFFNYLSGYSEKPAFHYLSISPTDIRKELNSLIEKEIEFHRKYSNGRIIAKMNSLTDKDIIMKLYEASIAGVQIDLIVRGVCCLRPGITGISDNIRVRSIVGRFLEHSRIYYFHHNGDEKTYLSSADLMKRNLDKRVEIMFPILVTDLKERVNQVLSLALVDNVKAREMDCDGLYDYVSKREWETEVESQLELFHMANPDIEMVEA